MKHRRVPFERPWIVAFFIALMISITVFLINFSVTSQISFLCNNPGGRHLRATLSQSSLSSSVSSSSTTSSSAIPIQLHAVLHYATTAETMQQSRAEIKVTFDILRSLSYSSNLLVFGLGDDSLMWSSFNANGVTFFLEDDAKLVHSVLTKAPNLKVFPVKYTTKLFDAKNLLERYQLEPTCLPPRIYTRGNSECRLMLSDLPDQVYKREWDVILIDGPRGFFPEAPGRMGPIFTAGAMARLRNGPGSTHVIVHDVNRKVERVYAERFLCRKYLVKAVDKLWHFVIPPATEQERRDPEAFFC